MVEYYLPIRGVHIATAVSSGTLFLLRGACAWLGMRWPRWRPVRIVGHAVDTTLLTTAFMLLSILPTSAHANGWLTTKLVLLAVYIGLGMVALWTARGRVVRAAALVAAALCFASMIVIARSHDPLGPWRLLQSLWS